MENAWLDKDGDVMMDIGPLTVLGTVSSQNHETKKRLLTNMGAKLGNVNVEGRIPVMNMPDLRKLLKHN